MSIEAQGGEKRYGEGKADKTPSETAPTEKQQAVGTPGGNTLKSSRRADAGIGSIEDSGKDREPQTKRPRIDSNGYRRLLACPYFKRDPVRFGVARACCGPGWASTHRLKYVTHILV
jgi:hypothetical protein